MSHSQRHQVAEVQALIKRVGCTDSVRCQHPKEYDFLKNLLLKHPRGKAHGLVDIQILHNRASYTLRFVKPGGCTDSISWRACISKPRTNHLTLCMRNAVRDQTVSFKEESDMVCEICRVSTTDDCSLSPTSVHVDHIEQFGLIKERFLRNTTAPLIFDKTGYTIRFCTHDQEFEAQWRDFHSKHARLRILCRTCNLTRKKRS